MFGTITCLKRNTGKAAPKKGDGTGYGFIEDESTKVAYFFHKNAMIAGNFDELTEGQRVEFDNEPSERGPRARNVRPQS